MSIVSRPRRPARQIFSACRRAVLGLVALMFCVGVPAAERPPAKVEAAIRAQLNATLQGAEVTSVSVTPMPGIYAVELDSAENAFVNAEGTWLISGDLYQVMPGKGLVNRTAQDRNGQRRAALAKVDRSQLITFPARGKERAAIYVFTDVDCGYCRKLHQEVPKLNEAGVAVHYLAFPRAGGDSETSRKMDAVWCALDRAKALSASKRGDDVAAPPAMCKSPVDDQYRLGVAMGVRGTPAIYDTTGEQIGGYVPAVQLIKQLLGR